MLELYEKSTLRYIYGNYAIYRMSAEARCMKCKIKKGVGCNFLKPRGTLHSTQPLARKANFLKFINALYFFILSSGRKKRITHLSHGIFSFFCLYRREREN